MKAAVFVGSEKTLTVNFASTSLSLDIRLFSKFTVYEKSPGSLKTQAPCLHSVFEIPGGAQGFAFLINQGRGFGCRWPLNYKLQNTLLDTPAFCCRSHRMFLFFPVFAGHHFPLLDFCLNTELLFSVVLTYQNFQTSELQFSNTSPLQLKSLSNLWPGTWERQMDLCSKEASQEWRQNPP